MSIRENLLGFVEKEFVLCVENLMERDANGENVYFKDGRR